MFSNINSITFDMEATERAIEILENFAILV
jgi:hypothetical protein